jgi:hypothetical protein
MAKKSAKSGFVPQSNHTSSRSLDLVQPPAKTNPIPPDGLTKPDRNLISNNIQRNVEAKTHFLTQRGIS